MLNALVLLLLEIMDTIDTGKSLGKSLSYFELNLETDNENWEQNFTTKIKKMIVTSQFSI